MSSVLSEVSKKYKITAVIWHQGESDFIEKTTTKNYLERFHSLINSIRIKVRDRLPIFYAVATKCGDNKDCTANNPTAKAQHYLSKDTNNIYLGVDSDNLLLEEDRLNDHCHLSKTGQLKTAHSFAKAILR